MRRRVSGAFDTWHSGLQGAHVILSPGFGLGHNSAKTEELAVAHDDVGGAGQSRVYTRRSPCDVGGSRC